MLKNAFIFLLLLNFTGVLPSYAKEFEELFAVKLNNKCGYINKKGKLSIKITFDRCWAFSEGFAGVEINNKLGFINTKGKFVIKPKFEWYPQYFKEGLVPVIFRGEDNLLHWGFANTKGKIHFIKGATFVDNFSEGLAVVQYEGKKGYVDKTFKFVIEPKFKYASRFVNGVASVCDQNDKRYYIDRFGRKVFEHTGVEFSDGVALVEIDGKNGFIDKNGKIIIPTKYPYYSVLSFYNGLAGINIDGKWGFINKLGEIVISPQFDAIQSFSEDGVAAVKIGNKWGFINKKGKIIISAQFDDALWFGKGIGRVEIGDKVGYINQKGNYIWHPTK
jgi:hypothetical protein